MALTKAKKHQKVAGLAADLQGATAAIIGTFSAMTADKDISLRKTVRDAGGKYSVLKNKLAPKAGAGTQIEGALGGLKGVSSIAYTSGDPVALAKALAGWVKDNSQFTFKLGIVDGQVLDVSEVQALATMPGKEELFSKLLWLINAPAQRLASEAAPEVEAAPQIVANTDADPAQPEDGADSQAGAAVDEAPVEGA
jgi:large subunit ribosomal protein L10